jgi:hypothetical protein
MPPNSISLEFNKMPTVTVDGETHKFQADGANGYKSITEGGVTYSLSKDKTSGRYTMTMSGEPAALEKYNFSVGKGRVTEGKFGSDSMGKFFKGSVSVGEKKNADNDYFQNFSIAGGHLANRTAFLQSGAWGLDQSSAETELKRLEEEAKAAAKKAEEAKKTSGTQDVDDQKPVDQKAGDAKEGISNIVPTHECPNTDKVDLQQKPSLTATSNQPLSADEVAMLKAGLNKSVDSSIDILSKARDNSTLREAFATFRLGDTESAQKILTEKANTYLKNDLSLAEKVKLTEANLAKLGLKANPTKGDGNCFFHAVADQGHLSQAFVRKQVASTMNDIVRRPSNRDLPFPEGLDGKPPTREQIDNTLLDASNVGEMAWGEDFHCAYVARAFDRPVVLIAPDRIVVYEKDQETRQISNPAELPKNAILLSHKGGNHWESASPIKP